jgi:hypothetical protein
MNRSKFGITAASLGLFLLTAGGASATPPLDQSDRGAGSANPQTTMKYDDTNAQPERFEGKVVCVPSEGKSGTTSASACKDDSSVLALSITESDVVHPIVAADDQLRDKLANRVGENVVIEGKRYESSGMIMASTVLSERAAK